MADPVFLRGWVLVLGTESKDFDDAWYLKIMPSNPLTPKQVAAIEAITRQDGKNVTVLVRIGGEAAEAQDLASPTVEEWDDV